MKLTQTSLGHHLFDKFVSTILASHFFLSCQCKIHTGQPACQVVPAKPPPAELNKSPKPPPPQLQEEQEAAAELNKPPAKPPPQELQGNRFKPPPRPFASMPPTTEPPPQSMPPTKEPPPQSDWSQSPPLKAPPPGMEAPPLKAPPSGIGPAPTASQTVAPKAPPASAFTSCVAPKVQPAPQPPPFSTSCPPVGASPTVLPVGMGPPVLSPSDIQQANEARKQQLPPAKATTQAVVAAPGPAPPTNAVEQAEDTEWRGAIGAAGGDHDWSDGSWHGSDWRTRRSGDDEPWNWGKNKRR